MDAGKPHRGETYRRNKSQPRDVLMSVLLLGVIVGIAFTVDLGPERRDPATLLQSSRDPSAPRTAAVAPQAVRVEETEAACYAGLRAAGVSYGSVSRSDARAIVWPLVLSGFIGGVRVHGTGKVDAPTNYLDCRLARTLLAWAPLLRARGVVGLEHYSMYRTESVVSSSDKPSGHALGRAIDVAKFEMNDGRILSVLDDWKNRARSADPCGAYPDDKAGRTMRELVCEAATRGLFQIIVTPHHNEAHANHVHLEVDPQAGSLWMR